MSPRRPFADIKTMSTLFPAAERAALAMGESEPGAEHLILAALDLPDGSAARAFERVGADPLGFREAVAAQHEQALRHPTNFSRTVSRARTNAKECFGARDPPSRCSDVLSSSCVGRSHSSTGRTS